MMRAHFGLLLLLLTTPSLAMAGSASDLERWVGKYPHQRIDGKRFLGTPPIARALRRIVPRERAARLRELTVASPIRKTAGFLIFHVCRAHACGDESATMAVRLTDSATVVAFWNHPDIECYTTRLQMTDLPTKVREVFAALPDAPVDGQSSDPEKPWIESLRCTPANLPLQRTIGPHER